MTDPSEARPLPQAIIDSESHLQRNPEDLQVRANVIEYYFEQLVRSGVPWGGASHESWKGHVFWMIEHRPESRLAGSPQALVQPPCGSQADYEQGKQLWLDQTKLHNDNPAVLRNAGYYPGRYDTALAQSLLEAAYALKPNDADLATLLSRLYNRISDSGDPLAQQKHEFARKALTLGEQGLNVAARERFYRLSSVAHAALQASDFNKARAYAEELLEAARNYETDWNYGNAIHRANIILGQIAVQAGDLNTAGEHLLAAGKGPGSPQLNSYGPNLSLARTLLEQGRREAVINYFKNCMNFWEIGRDRLRLWIDDLEHDHIPEFD